MNPNILFEDKHLIVCHKEAGIAVQSARLGQKDMVSMLNNYLMEKGEAVRVEVVHRLDQPVEGIIVFAKTAKAASELGKQLQQNQMSKIYHAVCCVRDEKWNVQAEEQILTDYLAKDGRTNLSRVVKQGMKDAKRAELAFTVRRELEKEGKRYLLTRIHLKTGRHHQIRVQMSHAGLPLYGDQKYNENWKDYVTEEDSFKRNIPLGLCAVDLSFKHPANGKQMQFQAEPKAEVFRMFGE